MAKPLEFWEPALDLPRPAILVPMYGALARFGWSEDFALAWAELDAAELRPARVAAEHRGGFEVWTGEGVLKARAAGRLHRRGARVDRPAVGDWVAISQGAGGDLAIVEQVLTRRTVFVRKVAGERTEVQVVAANVDTVLLVMSLNRDFKARRVERYLTQIAASGARPVVVLSKADLCDDPDAYVEALRERGIDLPIDVVTAERPESIAALRRYVPPGETLALVGSSGVGKSTIVNALVGEEVMAVGRIRDRDQRGRHTTARRQLIEVPDGGVLLDTPGMRELQLWATESEIDDAFDDVEVLAQRCRFSDCQHDTEPDCAVRAAIEAGTLDPARLDHYDDLQREAAHQRRRQNEHERREHDRAFGRMIRAVKKAQRGRKGG